MSEWQPIETAPHNLPILVFSTKYGVVIAVRNDDEGWSRDLGWACCDDVDDGFYLETASNAGLTNWMLLPKEPE